MSDLIEITNGKACAMCGQEFQDDSEMYGDLGLEVCLMCWLSGEVEEDVFDLEDDQDDLPLPDGKGT